MTEYPIITQNKTPSTAKLVPVLCMIVIHPSIPSHSKFLAVLHLPQDGKNCTRQAFRKKMSRFPHIYSIVSEDGTRVLVASCFQNHWKSLTGNKKCSEAILTYNKVPPTEPGWGTHNTQDTLGWINAGPKTVDPPLSDLLFLFLFLSSFFNTS